MSLLCPNCKKNTLISWSQYKEVKQGMGPFSGISFYVLKGLNNFWSGESNCAKQVFDKRSYGLLKCQTCNKYVLQCPVCKSPLILDSIPIETKTTIQCKNCRKIILYAQDDYSSGGG